MRTSPRTALVLSTLVMVLALLVTGVVGSPASSERPLDRTPTRQDAAPGAPRADGSTGWCALAARCRLLGLPSGRSVHVPSRPDLAVVSRAQRLGAVQCDDGSGAWCGTAEVPQDYDDPTGDTLTVSWKLYPHGDPGPGASTVAWIAGVPGADPIVPAGAELPDVPVLAVTGEYDGNVPVEDTHHAASLFPDFQHLSTGETPHTSGFWRCGPRRIRAFLDTLGDVRRPCTDKPELRWFVQPSFPQHAFGAEPLRVGNVRADHSTPRLRHLAGAAWQTVLDAWIVTFRRFVTTNHGLHGGTITDSFTSNTYAIDFHRYRFTRDLAVSGRLEQDFSQRVVVTRVRVDLPGHRHGRLVLRANLSLKRSGLLEATGTLAGRHVDLVGSTR